MDEYVEYINLLKNNENLRKKLSKNAKIYAEEYFSIENLINQWEKVFDEISKVPKTLKIWTLAKKELTSYDIFLES